MQTLWLAAVTVIAVAFLSSASAHELKPAVADVEFEGDVVVIEIDLVLEPIVSGMDLSSIFDTNESPKAAIHDTLRAQAPDLLEAELRKVWPDIAAGLNLVAGDVQLMPTLDRVTIAPVGDIELARDSKIVLSANIPSDKNTVQFGWAAAYGAIVVRQADGDPETAYTGYLNGGQLSEPIPRVGIVEQSWLAAFADYIVIGYEHIVPKGLDHILFVLGLFFFSLKMRPLLWQVSAFTVAHTVTLAMATLGLVSIPGSIVEPLIAASIVYVAVENVFVRRYHQWRTAVVFGFGLLHGLGFASVLGDVGLNSGRFLTGLIGFNIGVEVGQLSVIAAAWILIASWAGRKSWYRAVIATPASVASALVGAYWFLERTIL
jgi:hypothetical protein